VETGSPMDTVNTLEVQVSIPNVVDNVLYKLGGSVLCTTSVRPEGV
jgi:hypothetical protein